uniref:CSON012437 protein n=1 Tax=Culicoides sonorensis TaxID=179676 RepID=A0A336KMH8_CULSO
MKIRTRNNKNNKIQTSLILNYSRRRVTRTETNDGKRGKKKKVDPKEISAILRKSESQRSAEERRLLDRNSKIVKEITLRKERVASYKERAIEKEDEPDVIEQKARDMAEIIARSKHLVIYTGAGISTSAKIPDYRGSQGIWTLLQKAQPSTFCDIDKNNSNRSEISGAVPEKKRRSMNGQVIGSNSTNMMNSADLNRPQSLMMPQWYDVNYAYSGLHSIINPPPPNVELFEEEEDLDIPALIAARIKQTAALHEQEKNSILGTHQIECEFCYGNYEKVVCQFYKPLKPDFKVMIFRNGNPVVCECCDFSEVEEEEPENTSDTCQTQDKNDVEGNGNLGPDPESSNVNDESTEIPTKVQPGWYGKGWRVKTTNRRKRRRNT